MRLSTSKHLARVGRRATHPLSLAATAATLTLAASLTACGEGTGPGNSAAVDSLTALPRSLAPAERQAIDAGNAFALGLLKQVATSPATQGQNVLLSPLSVSMALGLTMNGAAGTTLNEMQQVLGWGTRSRSEINAAYRDLVSLLPSLDNSVTLNIANGVWVRRGLPVDTGFVSDARTFFKAPVEAADTPQTMFDAVNAWGNAATKGMLPKVLVQPPPFDLAMLLANAVYFNGAWRDKFDPAKTRLDGSFTLASGTEVKVPMMTRTGAFNGAYVNVGLERPALAAELLYGNGAYSMLLLMPQSGTVGELVQRVDTARLGSVVRSLRAEDGAVLSIPRFTLTASRELSNDLIALGMPRAFGSAAEFPRLIVNTSTRIGFVQHAVKLEVDERGTRAAGVTVVGIRLVSAPASFIFDKPFVVAIRERFTGTILFTGVVHDPR